MLHNGLRAFASAVPILVLLRKKPHGNRVSGVVFQP